MKKLFIIVWSIALIGLSSSCEEELDVDSKLNFPPTVVSVFPKSSVKIGNFDIKVVFADGAASPLSTATLILKDEAGNELHSITEPLVGIKDSIVIEGSTFNAAALELGNYSLSIRAVDTKNNETLLNQPFKVANQLYAANQNEMYIIGAFNGWSGGAAMELVADNTWQITELELDGGPFKFRNADNWDNVDWGDSNCDMTMEVTTGGGPNTECAYTGLVNVTFNDETLKYTVSPAVAYPTNLKGLYLLGSMNEYEGTQPKFNLIADYTWEIAEIRLKPGDKFKFAESPFFEGMNYGGTGMEGKAEKFGPSFVFDSPDAYYKITFNDKSSRFAITFVRAAYELFLVGGATSAGWTPENSLPFKTIGDKKYEIYTHLTTVEGFKFLIVQDWAGDWGVDPDNAGKIIQEDEVNATVDHDGFYRITVDLLNQTYEVVETNWAIIGSATPGGWELADTDMTYIDGTTWQVDVALTAGEFKFRANDDWPINFGKGAGANELEFNAGNLTSPGSGNYRISITLDVVNGYTYSITQL